ncbi:MAG: STAS domain-containing protein [Sporichthyaceae bacterium]|nr:STAS domain-containing protein [Sporichthyaceae bacterium]
MDGLRVSISVADDTQSVVTVAGELDMATADLLWAELEPVLQPGRTVVLHCGELEFMDSTGMRVLLRASRRATEVGGRFTMTEVQPAVARVLELAGVTSDLSRG